MASTTWSTVARTRSPRPPSSRAMRPARWCRPGSPRGRAGPRRRSRARASQAALPAIVSTTIRIAAVRVEPVGRAGLREALGPERHERRPAAHQRHRGLDQRLVVERDQLARTAHQLEDLPLRARRRRPVRARSRAPRADLDGHVRDEAVDRGARIGGGQRAPSAWRRGSRRPCRCGPPPRRPPRRAASACGRAARRRRARPARRSSRSPRRPSPRPARGHARRRCPPRARAHRCPAQGQRPCSRRRSDPASSAPKPTCGSVAAHAAAQDWLKKPFSISRARSSADTSTLRGVSRNTLSAIRCMPPSSA